MDKLERIEIMEIMSKRIKKYVDIISVENVH